MLATNPVSKKSIMKDLIMRVAVCLFLNRSDLTIDIDKKIGFSNSGNLQSCGHHVNTKL